MPKPPLTEPNAHLETDIIETMLAGLHQWRPDLDYPESHSDMAACIRALLTMYRVERRALPEPLASPCPDCCGLGHTIESKEGYRHLTTCPKCSYGAVYY